MIISELICLEKYEITRIDGIYKIKTNFARGILHVE